ncbi:hypothetical protein SVAN01_11234 [Stagonosporopsis vannaccii]|nr:hypothetical protein SVAN01_11234 [Stagonosporopsis vannaccii]
MEALRPAIKLLGSCHHVHYPCQMASRHTRLLNTTYFARAGIESKQITLWLCGSTTHAQLERETGFVCSQASMSGNRRGQIVVIAMQKFGMVAGHIWRYVMSCVQGVGPLGVPYPFLGDHQRRSGNLWKTAKLC